LGTRPGVARRLRPGPGHRFTPWGDRWHIRRDLQRKGCVLRRAQRLPWRRGLITRLSWIATDEFGDGVEYGAAYEVTYVNRDGTTRVAVCQMGADHLVFWTDEHPEPGFDRHGNPPNLSTYGQTWRG
jgi:hypothetical protein